MTGLAVAPRVLTWSDDSAALRRPIEQEYETLVHERLKQALAPEHAAGAEELDMATRRRVFLAPRTVRRLLWPDDGDRRQTAEFLAAALQAERVVAGLSSPNGFSGWTADCRALVGPGGVVCQPAAFASVPVDTWSPHARAIDLEGGTEPLDRPRPVLPEDRRHAASQRVADAAHLVRSSSATVGECLSAWTKVIVAQPDHAGRFSSGTNGRYVGRVVLTSVDNPAVPVEEIADALVHEAIHGFLYMSEAVEPWVHSPAVYTDRPEVASPWTGTLLPVRPFMQACFVWYGLAMFWADQLGGDAFSPAVVRRMLGRSLHGFTRGPLIDRLQPWRPELDPGVLAVIDDLQSTIVRLLA